MAVIRNLATGEILARRAEVATGWYRRARGLLGRRSLAAGEGMVFFRCRGIHTWGMRFPIDVVFLSQARVIHLVERLQPFSILHIPTADAVIELPFGTLARTSTTLGQLLSLQGDTMENVPPNYLTG